MKILILSSLFPPRVMGGAEYSAWNLARRLRDRGHEVAVMTTADKPEEEALGIREDGLEMWRMYLPYCYSMTNHHNVAPWKKPIWHLQDHIDPRNRKAMGIVLDSVRPEIVNVHTVQGLGFNTLSMLAERKIPTLYTLHSFEMVCVRAQMFKNGQECPEQCGICRLSSQFKARQVGEGRHIGFCAPSQAILDSVSKLFPIKDRPARVLLNPNSYPEPTEARVEADHVRLLFVGRLVPHKGISFLLSVLEPLAERFRFSMTVMGGGAEEQALRTRYQHAAWCHFTGHASEQEVSNQMENSDLLCIPSLWTENSPGVVIHALLRALPVIGSNKGGIPELIEDGMTGRLVEAGSATGWRDVIQSVLEAPQQLEKWRSAARQTAKRFDAEHLAEQYEEWLKYLRDA